MSRFRLFFDLRRGLIVVSLLASALAACSSDPPPTMDTVKKLVAEDRSFDALTTLIPMAQAGDPQAQYELAGFYHYGYVGPNDYAKALKWYRASARQGYADAMVGISVMYLGGQGVQQDRREAFVWLNLAAQYISDKQALAKIKRIRDEIGKNLTKDDIAFAKAETLLLQPESSSVQPNEAESIDHLPEQLPPEAPPAPVSADPLQNVPPETSPLTDIPLQNAPPLPPSVPLSTRTPTPAPQPAAHSTTLPATTATQPAPAATQPAVTAAPPGTTLPATTPPATPVPIIPPVTTEAPPSAESAPDTPVESPAVKPVPEF